ncbi:unnamed protein product [Sphacelaria rigidula]
MCLAWASLFTLVAFFTSSSSHFTALLHTTSLLPMTLLAELLINCCHPSTIFALALPLSISVSTAPTLSNNSENVTPILIISSWNSCCFSSISSLSILHLYNFLPHPLLKDLVCCLSVHQAMIRSSHVLCADERGQLRNRFSPSKQNLIDIDELGRDPHIVLIV